MIVLISDWENSLACRLALRIKADCDVASVTYIEPHRLHTLPTAPSAPSKRAEGEFGWR